LTNGYSRPYGLPNLWISDDRPGESQSITVKFKAPAGIGKFYIIFDTGLAIPSSRMAKDERWVKKYTVSASNEKGQIFEEILDDCCKRRFVHNINKSGITGITIHLEETLGASYYSIFSLFAEPQFL
jgi:hypothetical protein